MRRVLHVTPYLDATAGGPPVVVERLAAHALENGYVANVLTSAERTQDAGKSLQQTWEEAVVLPTQVASLHGVGRQKVTDAIRAADIVHLHTLWSPLVAQSAVAARRQGVPYVLSPHGMLDPYSINQKWLKKRLYLAMVERRTLCGAARLQFTADDEERLARPIIGVLPASVIPLGADRPPGRLEILKEEFFSRHPDLRNRKIAIFLGRLHDKKRPKAALRAVARVLESRRDVCLLIAGAGEEEAKLRRLASKPDLSGHVRFLGFLTGREQWQALAAADVFLLPSRQENFAIALAEALHSGVPALITRNVNIWRLISDAGAGLILDDEDLEAGLAEGMLSYFFDEIRHSNASQSARGLAERNFDWVVSARMTHRLYDEVLGAQAPSA